MSTTLVTLAADYVSHLLVQQVPLETALTHAKQRFGVEFEPIVREIEARHSFSLAASEPEPLPDAPAPAAKLEAGDRCEVCDRVVYYGEIFHEDSPAHLKALLAQQERTGF